MNLKQLEAFVYIAEGHSFSQAARELYLTQPTISAHISSLEKELNVRLLVRNTKEVHLSEEGRRLYEYAKRITDLETEIFRVFKQESEGETTCINIAASTIPTQYILPELLSIFRKQHPGEQFKLIETDSAGAIEEVENHRVDIGFTGTMMEKRNCKYIPFYEDELVVITPNTPAYRDLEELYEEQNDKEKDLSWVLEKPMIMREEGSGTRKEAEKQLKLCGLDISQLNLVASIENQEMIKKSVSNGMGISVISKLATEDEVGDGRLLRFSLPSGRSQRSLNVVYNMDYKMSASAERLLKAVKNLYLKKPRGERL